MKKFIFIFIFALISFKGFSNSKPFPKPWPSGVSSFSTVSLSQVPFTIRPASSLPAGVTLVSLNNHNSGNPSQGIDINIKLCNTATKFSIGDLFQGGHIEGTYTDQTYYISVASTGSQSWVFSTANSDTIVPSIQVLNQDITNYQVSGAIQYNSYGTTNATCSSNCSGVFFFINQMQYYLNIEVDRAPSAAVISGIMAPLPSNFCINASPFDLTTVNNTGTWLMWTGSIANTVVTNTLNPLTATGGNPGLVNVVLKGNYNACAYTAGKPVTILPVPQVAYSANSTVCQNSPFSITAYLASGLAPASYSYFPADSFMTPNGSITNTATTAVHTGGAGVVNFSVSLTDANGCSFTSTSSYTVLAQPTASLTPSTASFCNPGSVQLAGNGSSAAGGITYSWTPTTGLSSTSIGNPIATPTTTTTYTMTVKDKNNCTKTKTATVTVNQPPTGTISITGNQNNITSGTPVEFSTTAVGTTYEWNFGDSSTSIEITPWHYYYDSSSTGFNVSVLVTDPNGCSATITKPNAVKVKSTFQGFVTGTSNSTSKVPFNVNVYPVPVENFLNIDITGQGDNFYLEIYNDLGVKIASAPLDQSTIININEFNLQHGIYLLKVNSSVGSRGVTIIKQ